ncbi:hypothetical protein D0862_04180 [Hortaea werneckii]|uniref:Alpha/beta hydrolase fold-3 domain-containing protein n=1 Tax=Hortaea werneckii TaxID=91943 RepID=A0A3M7H367_HORWE|nr:hypothetical protein D0862_04180 [Hortaea werneckii]
MVKLITPKTRYNLHAPHPRWYLHLQAMWWRALMAIGMLLHRLAPPRPPKPDFEKQIPSTLSGKSGTITLQCYVPKDWKAQKSLWQNKPVSEMEEDTQSEGEADAANKGKGRRVSTALSNVSQSMRRRSQGGRRWGKYPVVLNFHGGGFTLGTAMDDARWSGTVVDEVHAVVVSVEYRKAPEHPFPTPVEDGVDAVLWVHQHAEELGIDREKIALSGFSSGGNMCITVALRLWDELNGFARDAESRPNSRQRAERALHGAATMRESDSSGSTKVPPEGAHIDVIHPDDAPAIDTPPDERAVRPSNQMIKQASATVQHRALPDVRLRMLIPWYPSLDYTRTRAERRATNIRKDQELPAVFTDLFDQSYLHPPDTVSLDSPYISPGVAPTSLLKNGLPHDIIMHTCEYDMLLDEGQSFHERLISPEIGKNVVYKLVKGVPHGWDKAPNPLKPTPGVREHYLACCKAMRDIFGTPPGVTEHETAQGPSAAPRGSTQVVR